MEFKNTTLSKISINNKGMYGIGAPAVEFDENLPTYLRITDITDDGNLIESDLKSVDSPKYKNYILKANDIVFARTGNSTGRNYFYNSKHGKLVYAGFLIKFSLDSELVFPKYIKYYCQTKEYWGWVNGVSTGSTRKNINAAIYGEMPITLPPKVIQKKIVNILEKYDYKIETNNKIIANLEAQAQALFKYYFVDFEPFSDENFVDSDLGPIPEGWEVSDIKNMSRKVVTGKTPSTKNKEYFGNYINFVKIPDMHGKIYSSNTDVMLSEEGMKSQSTKTIPKDSILVSCIATVGLVNIASREVQTNQQINSIIPKASNMRYYLYFVMKNMNKLLNAIGSSGSTTKNINKRTFANINLIKPDEKTLDEFDNLILPFFECIKLLYEQNQILAEARDALLPKLMAGEIDLEGLGGSYD